MPDALMQRVKITAAKRKTTFRALVVDALERTLNEVPQDFELEDASAGNLQNGADAVSATAINERIDALRESRFHP